MPDARAHIGTSGWNYRWWRGVFYPEDVPQRDWHGYYVRHFDTVEINATFYRLQRVETFERWRAAAPEGFVYAVKASRLVTHLKRLQDCEEPLSRFLEGVRALGPTLGPILYQLPPRFESDPGRLDAFADLLPTDLVNVFEFRDPSWFTKRTYDLLRRREVALVVADRSPEGASPWVDMAGWSYLRFHHGRGRNGNYSERQLREWSSRLKRRRRKGDVYAYFNNDWEGFAVANARKLRALVDS
jgi:uncharacterized protein YecE (DUF72 family)